MTYYVVETDLDHTSLDIKAADTHIKGSVGNITRLNNLDIESSGSVTVDGSVQVDNHVKATAKTDATFHDSIEAEKEYVKLNANNNVTVDGKVSAGTDVDMTAVGGSVLANGDITAGGHVHLNTSAEGEDVTTIGAVEAKGGDVEMWGGNNVTTHGVVEAHDGVTMKAGNNVDVKAAVTTGGNFTAQASKNITTEANGTINAANGSVELTTYHENMNVSGKVTAGKDVKLTAGQDISVADVTANQKVLMKAGRDVTINGYIKGLAQEAEDAVDIRAQKRFLNKAADSAEAIQVGTGSHWKVYSETPYEDDFGGGVNSTGLNRSDKDLSSGNYAVWGWDREKPADEVGNRYIFKYPRPTMTLRANDVRKEASEDLRDKNTGYMMRNSLSGQFLDVFLDGDDEKLVSRDGYAKIGTYSDGFAPNSYPAGTYKDEIKLTNTDDAAPSGFNLELLPGTLTVYKNPPLSPTPSPNPNPDPNQNQDSEQNQGDNLPDKPYMDQMVTDNLQGTASYTMAQKAQGAGVDRVLGLQSAELPFFNERNGAVKLYGTYDVSVDPEKVTMEPTAKVLPEPDQPRNQYREYERELTTANGTAKFKLTYDGSVFNIYPTDGASMNLLVAGDGTKNVEVESQALFAAFKEMGITLDDLDGVYTHFEKA